MAGNANSGRREKPFVDALRLEISENSENPRALRMIARQLIKFAMAGEGWAIKEFADRLDGKPAQQLIHSGSIALTHEEALDALDNMGPEERAPDSATLN